MGPAVENVAIDFLVDDPYLHPCLRIVQMPIDPSLDHHPDVDPDRVLMRHGTARSAQRHVLDLVHLILKHLPFGPLMIHIRVHHHHFSSMIRPLHRLQIVVIGPLNQIDFFVAGGIFAGMRHSLCGESNHMITGHREETSTMHIRAGSVGVPMIQLVIPRI